MQRLSKDLLVDRYNEIIKILEGVAKEKGIPDGLLKKIYDMERRQVHLSSRDNIDELRRILFENLSKVKLDEV